MAVGAEDSLYSTHAPFSVLELLAHLADSRNGDWSALPSALFSGDGWQGTGEEGIDIGV